MTMQSLGRRACPLLDRPTPSVRLPEAPDPWELRQCSETGFVYLDNPAPPALLEQDHAWEVSWAQANERRAQDEPLRHQISSIGKRLRVAVRRNKVRDLAIQQLQTRPADQRALLDVGCGGGDLLLQVAERLAQTGQAPARLMGIDLSKALAKEADAKCRAFGGQCLQGTALEALRVLPAASMDVITLASFLEHEPEPLSLLKACKRALREDGIVVVKVPNYDCWNRRLRGPRWCGYRWPDHVNYFTPATLQRMAQAAGLRVARMNALDRSPLSDSLYAVLAP
ncbi:MAG: class I SAM-dependent methyltransferase [Burkholderiales bacterium]